jgi:hypothetical protein
MSRYFEAFLSALWDVLPVALVLFAFQYLVLRRPFPQPGRVAAGFLFMLVGLALLLMGLNHALFPLGTSMTEQLIHHGSAVADATAASTWSIYLGVGAFAATITFAAVFAEPVLTALADRAEQVSGGTINAARMRLVVAFGAAAGVTLSLLRLVHGTPIAFYVAPVAALIWVQSRFTPPVIRPLAYDAGVAGISTIMVPLLVAIGTAMAAAIPGRSVLIDGFGLVILAALAPVSMVLAYAQIAAYLVKREKT